MTQQGIRLGDRVRVVVEGRVSGLGSAVPGKLTKVMVFIADPDGEVTDAIHMWPKGTHLTVSPGACEVVKKSP